METMSPGPITTEMTDLIAHVRLAYVATVNPDGTANLSPKGSLQVVDSRRLAFANLASPATVRNVVAGSSIEINVVDTFRRRGYRFRGTATHTYDQAVVELVAGSLGPQYLVDGAVIVEVSEAAKVWSPVYDRTSRSESDVEAEFRMHYQPERP